MSITEIIFCVTIILPIIPIAFFKQWRLFWIFLTFYFCFGLQEWLSIAQTGQSISQHFWVFDSQYPLKGWVIIGSMALMWISLLIHFKKHKK